MTAYTIYSTLTDRNIKGLRGSSALSLLHSFMLNSALADRQLDQTTPSDRAGGTEDYTVTSFPGGSFPVVPLDQVCVLFPVCYSMASRHVCVLTSWLILSVGLRGAELSHCEHRISEICSQSELSPAPHETSSDITSRCSPKWSLNSTTKIIV